MIALVRGTVVSRTVGADGGRIVVDVGGVGYLVSVPAGASISATGEEVALHTSLQVREDSMTLYGFPTAGAREMFELLLDASGVGPKLALAALSTHPADTIRRAVAEGDLDVLTMVPGIGKKVAQRLVLELRDRVGAVGDEIAATPNLDAAGPLGEVRLALLELGYTPAEAQRAVAPLNGGGEVGDLLRQALRRLAAAGAAT